MSATPKEILQSVFGHQEFRANQREIIDHVLEGHDAVVIMPTGGGKSICYQIPALIFDGLTIVVSPLISLMQDQVEQLRSLDVDALYLNSSLPSETYRQHMSRLREDPPDLLYVAPETLMKSSMRSLLSDLQVDCITIDEAHCISEWGHDFRPEYRKLHEIRRQHPDSVLMALTATATPRVREDIKDALDLDDAGIFTASFDRPNLFLEVQPKEDPLRQTLDLLEDHADQSGIIYCFSRRQVDELSDQLRSKDYSALPYHAGLSEEIRNANQEAFVRDEVNIIVATIAFGMGIDKPDVRFIIHFDLPKSIEAYYQQIGRAGRDGDPSHCLLLFSYSDIQKIKYIINSKSDDQQRKVAETHLTRLLRYVESGECRRKQLLSYFGETYPHSSCDYCDTCTEDRQQGADVTVPAQKFLSTAIRTDQIFGANHLIDVLRGARTKKILRHKHDQLSVYGIGTEYTIREWWKLFQLLQQRGYIRRDPEYGSLIVDSSARPLLKGEEQLFGQLEFGDRSNGSGNGNPASDLSTFELDFDSQLFNRLRNKRNEMADQQDIPPYVICSNRSLKEMAAYHPQSEEALMEIYGMGKSRCDNYGEELLKTVRKYLD